MRLQQRKTMDNGTRTNAKKNVCFDDFWTNLYRKNNSLAHHRLVTSYCKNSTRRTSWKRKRRPRTINPLHPFADTICDMRTRPSSSGCVSAKLTPSVIHQPYLTGRQCKLLIAKTPRSTEQTPLLCRIIVDTQYDHQKDRKKQRMRDHSKLRLARVTDCREGGHTISAMGCLNRLPKDSCCRVVGHTTPTTG